MRKTSNAGILVAASSMWYMISEAHVAVIKLYMPIRCPFDDSLMRALLVTKGTALLRKIFRQLELNGAMNIAHNLLLLK